MAKEEKNSYLHKLYMYYDKYISHHYKTQQFWYKEGHGWCSGMRKKEKSREINNSKPQIQPNTNK